MGHPSLLIESTDSMIAGMHNVRSNLASWTYPHICAFPCFSHICCKTWYKAKLHVGRPIPPLFVYYVWS